MAHGWVREGVALMMAEMGMSPCGPDTWEGEIEGAHVTWTLIDGSLFIDQGRGRLEISVETGL